jgi:hypothetical protein
LGPGGDILAGSKTVPIVTAPNTIGDPMTYDEKVTVPALILNPADTSVPRSGIYKLVISVWLKGYAPNFDISGFHSGLNIKAVKY